MDLELAQVAAGLPMAASLAVAGGFLSVREGRRRSALNEAVHELRRPLQALSLSLPEEESRAEAVRSSLVLATAALERLDREINGREVRPGRSPVALEPLLEAASARWRAHTNKLIELHLEVCSPSVQGEEIELAQAVDNLISNAIEHGGGLVSVRVGEHEGRLLIAVLDRGPAGTEANARSRPPLRARIGGRNRRGHGLRVVERVARAHGGRFELRRSEGGAEARLELPCWRSEASG
ncbi:MAG TPA: ATP-binding protein [Solirubrobacterales bacterium]|nr:ATP-binding protein [Solirubrobacterales bacterium]